MDGQLKTGTILTSEAGEVYTVKQLLGSGGQGEVYSVEAKGISYALKWYFPKSATKNQKDILDNLIIKGKPDESFLWPQDLIFEKEGKPFGYIMPLRPKNYKGIIDMMKRKAEPSFSCLCKAAFNLTKGYRALHNMGYCYRDISFGNVFLDPDTGDVLICDNDNVSYNSAPSGIYGTPRFMAPEIVNGKAKPSTNTDLFSLAVLLFYMFMLNHPLEGKLEAEIKCMDYLAMNRLYGEHPVFIFDPKDTSNRPVRGYQDNALLFWDLYPRQLKELFIRSFTVGINEANKRVTEAEWLDVLANLISGIEICPNCQAEVFYDMDKVNKNTAHICWSCQKTVKMPHILVSGKSVVLLQKGNKLYKHHITGNRDMSEEVGEVVENPKNPDLLGIKNKTQDNWTYIRADGTQIPVAHERSAAIVEGAKINFGQLTGEFV